MKKDKGHLPNCYGCCHANWDYAGGKRYYLPKMFFPCTHCNQKPQVQEVKNYYEALSKKSMKDL